MKTSEAIVITRANDGKKKFFVIFPDSKKHIKFGSVGYDDFTIHKDPERQKRYIARHRKNEDWTVNGRYTPGFWARYILWNKPNLRDSIAHTSRLLKKPIILR